MCGIIVHTFSEIYILYLIYTGNLNFWILLPGTDEIYFLGLSFPLFLWLCSQKRFRHVPWFPVIFRLCSSLQNIPCSSVSWKPLGDSPMLLTYSFSLHDLKVDSDVTATESLFCGAMSGILSKIIIHPLDVVKKRLQVEERHAWRQNNAVVRAWVFHLCDSCFNSWNIKYWSLTVTKHFVLLFSPGTPVSSCGKIGQIWN